MSIKTVAICDNCGKQIDASADNLPIGWAVLEVCLTRSLAHTRTFLCVACLQAARAGMSTTVAA